MDSPETPVNAQEGLPKPRSARKRGKLSTEEKKARVAERRARENQKHLGYEDTVRTEKQAAFMAALVTTKGNASAAAEMVGMHPAYGRNLISRNKAIRAFLDELKMQNLANMRPWDAHAALAQDEVTKILTDPKASPMARLKAAEMVLAYHIGTPVKRSEDVTKRQATGFTPELARFVVQYMSRTGSNLSGALEYAKKHPGEVRVSALQDQGVETLVANPATDDGPEEGAGTE